MRERDNRYFALTIKGVLHYPDNSIVTRVIRKKLTGLDEGRAGGAQLHESPKGLVVLARVNDIGKLHGEQNSDAEIQLGVGLGMLGLDADEALLILRKLQDIIGTPRNKEPISTDDIERLMGELEQRSTGSLAKAEEILRQYKSEEEQFKRKIKEN